ncbi:M12 family metallopeptidase [Pseudomonas sp. S09G 359]|jgi:hypothetical protein|uniref:M12 family metallopeptidase n=1 Tax=Pseudomonas sp. S09G 359 TaxID=2054919 RepID=UPI000C6E8EF8|nr:M12 family metallopeptidase [Pseudomonas sp. S09G 359]AUG06260.1 hypothetical protein CXQ82_06555 [Pseudomonas sp. S09G 359]
MTTIPAFAPQAYAPPFNSEITPPVSIRPTRGIASPQYLWPQNATLNISLFNMSDKAKDYIKERIKLWQPHTNLKFNFIATPDGDIRISGRGDGSGNQSVIGTQARNRPIDQPTMHIDLVDKTAQALNHSIRHEFGHALGLEHEHQHPDNTIHWNKKELLDATELLGINEAETKFNILTVFDRNTTIYSAYDQKSIMHYSVDSELTTDNIGVPLPVELSEGDKAFMRSLYPPTLETPAS